MASGDAAAALYLPRKHILEVLVLGFSLTFSDYGMRCVVSDSTLTIRVIKNFPYRTTRNLVLHHLDLTALTAGELKEMAKKEVLVKPGWKAYKTVVLDTLKLYTKAQGTKTQNLIINMEDKDELIFRDDNKTLADCGCEHETEISFFNMADYLGFKANPEEKW